MNIITVVTYLTSGLYTKLRIFQCKKYDVGYYVINHGVYMKKIVLYRQVYIVSISSLRKIVNACQN